MGLVCTKIGCQLRLSNKECTYILFQCLKQFFIPSFQSNRLCYNFARQIQLEQEPRKIASPLSVKFNVYNFRRIIKWSTNKLKYLILFGGFGSYLIFPWKKMFQRFIGSTGVNLIPSAPHSFSNIIQAGSASKTVFGSFSLSNKPWSGVYNHHYC